MASRYFYKILDSAPPDNLPQTLPATDLDANDGFIHLSTAEQTPITADLFFKDVTHLWILKVDETALDGRIEMTTASGTGVENGCPHLHDSEKGLGRSNVVEVLKAQRNAGQRWSEVDVMKRLKDS